MIIKIIHGIHCKLLCLKVTSKCIWFLISSRLIYYIEKNDPATRKIMSKFPLNTIKLNSCKTNPHGYMYYDQTNYQNYMGYMHTFAVTDSYVILPVSNYVMNPCFAHPDARKSNVHPPVFRDLIIYS